MEEVNRTLEENLHHKQSTDELLPTFHFEVNTEKNFRKRSGTTDKGKKYENMVTASTILRLVSTNKVKNFHVSSDDPNFGAFDDVVIEVETDDGVQTIAVQLKHSNNPGNLRIKRLASEKGDFSILKYFKSFQEIKKKPHQSILFTNLKFKVFKDTKFQLDGKDFFLEPYEVEIADDCLKLSQDVNYCHKFRIVEDEHPGSKELQQFKTFLENFSLYTRQQSLERLEKSTAKNFEKTFSSNEETFEKYLKILSQWDMQEGLKLKLDKKMMQHAIALCLLSPYIEHFTFGPVNDNGKILRDAISVFDITLLEKTECDLVKRLWGDLDENIDIKELNKLRSFYRLSSNFISRIEDVDENALARLLWLMGKRPLIVQEHENIEKAINLCPCDKFVLLGQGKWTEWMNGRSVFQNLLDLKSEQNLFERVIQNFTISLQGKDVVNLMDISRGNEEILKNISVSHLLEMIDSPRLIDGEKEVLPNPYIERYLSLNVIDIKYLECVNRGTVVILNCSGSSNELQQLQNISLTKIDDYLNDPKCRTSNAPIFIISKSQCSQSEFEKICSKTPKSKTVHYFKFFNNVNLEWVRSRGDIEELQNYKLGNHSKNETDFWTFEFKTSINLVIDDPGMGKTELTKSLKNKCPSKYWTVIVTPQEVNLFFKQSEECEISDYLNLFQTFIVEKKYHYLKNLDKAVFKMCCEQLNVCYVWDALDEISSKYLEQVSDLIVLLSKKGFIQWITGRKHLETLLVQKFNTLPLNINQFNESEQEDYIRQRLNPIVSADHLETAIRKIKSSFAFIKHIDILGIPLQIFMLTEIVLQNKDKYLKLFGDSWRLTDLYSYFIDEKFNIFYQTKLSLNIQDAYSKRVFNSDKEKILTHYAKLAIKLIFSDCADISLEVIDSTCYDYAPIGIITGLQNNTPLFLHASFAEYLAAVYFSKNFDVIPRDRFFDRQYNNVRFFFDMLLAKKSPAQNAILYRNFDGLKSYDDEILTRKDDAGRNALHLICSWGQRHSRLTVKSSKIDRNFPYFVSAWLKKTFFSDRIRCVSYSFNDYGSSKGQLDTKEYLDGVRFLSNECGNKEPDELFKMTPLSHARVSESLGAELELLQLGLEPDQSYNHCDRINILYYSSLFGYDQAIKSVFTKTLSTCYDEINFVCERSGYTALVVASASGHQAVVDNLLQLGAEISCLDKRGRTPLYTAAFNGHEKVVECLLKSGADINRCNNLGWTPLYVASWNGFQKTVECLVKCGAEIDRGSHRGWTPLYAASFNGHENTVECLLKSGAEINRANNCGSTPLHAASSNGHEKTVECLVKFGAEINRVDNNGQRAVFAASAKGHECIVEYLVKCGAEFQ
ncbi:uncharacterized protein LOC135137853 [Zophobas morio]|uniref:uncharacterized protein LOC135137853 n=1 Tax=Zophobas morio TaxID=2755281 RepID=UPI00308313F3